MKENIKQYDVIIVGAGPCGIFSALEFAGKKKVAIIDAGVSIPEKKCEIEECGRCKYCKPICNVLGGFGGAQFFQGTKLSIYPAGTGLTNFCDSIETLKELYNYADIILENMGKPKRTQPTKQEIEDLKKMFNDVGIVCKYYNAQKITKKIVNLIGNNIHKVLDKNGVDIFLKEQMLNIEKENDVFIVKTDKNQYRAKFVILAMGRLGSRQLTNISDHVGIKYNENKQQVEIGVIIEMPFEIFKKVNNIHNDIKLKVKFDNGDEVRSFCQDYKGYITRCAYNLKGDRIVTTLDGHLNGTDEHGGKLSDTVNISVRHRYISDDEIGDVYENINNFNHKGKPIVQTMRSFMAEEEDDKKKILKTSMPDIEGYDINKKFTPETAKIIKNFINQIDSVLPGFADDNNLVYAPSFEMVWKKIILDKKFESTIKGIYIGGDSTGYFKGAMQAFVSGIIIARNILNTK